MARKNREWLRYIGMVLFAACLCLGIAGCSILDKFQSWKAGSSTDNSNTEMTTPNTENGATDTNTAIDKAKQKSTKSKPIAEGEGKEVSLYFSDGTGQVLKVESRTIPKAEGIAKATINELIAGPSDSSGLVATIPTGTVLNGINIKDDGLCVVDFSNDLLYSNDSGTNSEFLTVYSIVNTLTQFESVDKVQILVDGKVVKTLAGNINIAEPVSAVK